MHRILYAHEKVGVSVYSLNKNTKLQYLDFREDIVNKGKILAVEWIFNEYAMESSSFIVGFSEGYLELYKSENNLKG